MPAAQPMICADCDTPMSRIEEVQHPAAKCRFLEFYRCQNVACQRKAVLQWEKPDGALTEADLSFVEREVMNRGAWFPSDGF